MFQETPKFSYNFFFSVDFWTISTALGVMSSKQTKQAKKRGGEFRKMAQKVEKGRNWTDLETEAFCSILADQELNFCFTLETRALKKSSNKEVFEALQKKFRFFMLASTTEIVPFSFHPWC